MFVEQNPQAGMQAFMSGKIQITGDMTKIMGMMQGTPDPAASEIAARLKAVTDVTVARRPNPVAWHQMRTRTSRVRAGGG